MWYSISLGFSLCLYYDVCGSMQFACPMHFTCQHAVCISQCMFSRSSYVPCMLSSSLHANMYCAFLTACSQEVCMFPCTVHVLKKCACPHAMCMPPCNVHAPMQCACPHALCMPPMHCACPPMHSARPPMHCACPLMHCACPPCRMPNSFNLLQLSATLVKYL
jgi:hypothetical protein